MIARHTFVLLVTFCSFLLVYGDIALSSTALVQEKHYYAATVDHAAQAVLQKLNHDKQVTKGARISKVDLEDTKVAESVLYSVNLQVDFGSLKGKDYELQFVHPVSEWRHVHAANVLPTRLRERHSHSTSLALHGATPYYLSPEISLNLTGPMELYFPHPSTELVVKTPRYVDVGYVERIIVKEGTNITLVGSAELRLRDSLSIYPTISTENNRLVINTKDTPKFNVYGQRVEIKNLGGEELKVKKKYASVLEVDGGLDSPVKASRLPFEISLNDSRIETIKYAMTQWGASHDMPFNPVVRKLSSGSSMEAVVSFLIPLEVEDSETGITAHYDVVVVQGSNHKEAQVISVVAAKVQNQVTIDSELAVNGSLPDAMARLHAYLETSGRLAM